MWPGAELLQGFCLTAQGCLGRLTTFGIWISRSEQFVAVVDQPVAPGGTRRERMRAMMREDILAAARAILQESGVKGLAMRPLGRAVGVTAPTLYDYFPSKDAVLDALYVEGADRLCVAFDEATAASQPGLDRLTAIGRAYRQFALDNPDLYFLIFGRVDASYRPGDEEKARGHAVHEKLEAVVREAIEIGALRAEDPELICNAMWALAHGQITLEISGFVDECGPWQAEQLYEKSWEFLYSGLMSPAAGAERFLPPLSATNG